MKPWTIALPALVVLLLVVANRRVALGLDSALVGDGSESLPDDPSGVGAEQGQGSTTLEWLGTFDPASWIPAMTDDDTKQANRAAILMTIRKAEGTAGVDGYRTMFGGRLFSDFSDHPRKPVQFTNKVTGSRLWTSAAGAYQFMAVSPIPGGGSTRVNTWDRMQDKLGLPDFGPASQDAAALQLIDDAGALGDVDAGRFDDAISKIRGIWASLPGAGYSQPERSIDYLRQAFVNAGGTLA